MSKSIYIMSTPKGCINCPLGKATISTVEYYVLCRAVRMVTVDQETETRPNWCPLVGLPERLPESEFRECKGSVEGKWEVPLPENKGWNACLDRILGDKNLAFASVKIANGNRFAHMLEFGKGAELEK